MKLKFLVIAVGLVIALLVLASCGGGGKQDDPFLQPDDQPAPAGEPDDGDVDTASGGADGSITVEIALPPGINVDPVDFVIDDHYAYFTDSTYGLVLIDIADTSRLNLVGWTGASEIRPGELVVSGGYAYIGAGKLIIIDVDPLESASLAGELDTGGDIGKFVLSGNLLYTASRSEGMHIIDVSDPGTPALVNSVGGSFNDVEYADGYAYMASDADGLTIISVEPPEDAGIVNIVGTTGDGSSSDVKILGGFAYIVTPDTGLEVINVSPPENAEVVHTVATMGNRADKLILFDGYAYVYAADNTVDVIDIGKPAEAGISTSYPDYTSNRKIATLGDLMFILEYEDGLRITALQSE